MRRLPATSHLFNTLFLVLPALFWLLMVCAMGQTNPYVWGSEPAVRSS